MKKSKQEFELQLELELELGGAQWTLVKGVRSMSEVKTQRSNKVKGKWQNFNQRRPSSSQSAGNSTPQQDLPDNEHSNREERIVKGSEDGRGICSPEKPQKLLSHRLRARVFICLQYYHSELGTRLESFNPRSTTVVAKPVHLAGLHNVHHKRSTDDAEQEENSFDMEMKWK